jgi:hypothetical protein
MSEALVCCRNTVHRPLRMDTARGDGARDFGGDVGGAAAAGAEFEDFLFDHRLPFRVEYTDVA